VSEPDRIDQSRAAQLALRDAAADLDALRTAVSNALGAQVGKAENPADQPILDAWEVARARYRRACAAYAKEMVEH